MLEATVKTLPQANAMPLSTPSCYGASKGWASAVDDRMAAR